MDTMNAIDRKSSLSRTVGSFHTFVRRMAAIAVLLGFCTAVVQAVPRIVEVRTAAPKVLVAVLETDVTWEPEGGTAPDQLDILDTSKWKVVKNGVLPGVSPQAIHRYSSPWDEGERHPWNDPVPERRNRWGVT